MSYSRRQLYAMGETFGDSATRMEAGGRIVYGGGGGGGNKTVEPTTTITESGPTITNRTTANEIPNYLTDASQDLVARGQALTSRPFEAYGGARVAEFSPLMNQAFQRMGGQQVAGQIGQATGLAGLAGERAMQVGSNLGTYNPYEMGGFTADKAQQYMNPYMQNVVDIERRKAQEASDQQAAMLSGQAAKQGAFGGSGAALQQRALRRDTAQQLADLQTQGMGRAFEQGLSRFGAEEAMREQSRQFGANYGIQGQQLGLEGLRTGLSASGQLAGLGQTQFGQEMDITKGLGTAGDVQRQREQALLDVGYGDYLTAQKYPYEQLAFQQSLVSGVPYSTTQRTSEVSQPGKTVSQKVSTTEAAAAQGGEIKRYADGGITSLLSDRLLSDQQIAERKQMPNISDLARLALQAKEMENARLRADQQNMDAQQAQMGEQPTVAELTMLESGIGGLDVPDNLVGGESMAGGGIVAFQNLGAVPAPVPAVNYGLPAISTSLIPKPAQDLMAQQRRLAMEAAEQEKIDAEAYLRGIRDDQKALGDPYAPREERLKAREGKFEGAEVSAAQNAFLRFGLGVIASKGEKNKAKALANAGIGTLDSYGKEMDKIEQSKAAVEEARSRLDELRYSNQKGDKEAVRNAEKDLNKAKRSATSALGTIFGNDADKIISAYDKKLSRDAQYAAANKPTDMRNYVRDVELAAKGDPQAKIRVEAANQYIGTQKAAQIASAQTAAGKSDFQIRKEAMDVTNQTLSVAGDRKKFKEYSDLAKLDRKDNGNRAEEYKAQLFDKVLEGLAPTSAAPASAPPATSAAPAAAPASAPPPAAVNMLRQNPSDIAKQQFDAAFGPGAANRALAGR